MTPRVKKIVKWTLVAVVALWMIPFTMGLVHLMSQGDPTPQGAFPLRERWQIKLDSEVVAEPSTGSGMVIIQTYQKVYALDPHSGSLMWEARSPSGIRPAPALIADDLVVIGYQEGVIALDAGTGHIVWQASDTNCSAADIVPAASNEKMIYVVRNFCNVRAYDSTTGAVVWQANLPTGRSSADLFLDQGRIYLVVSEGTLEILDSTTGALLDEIQGQVSTPAAYQTGVLYGFIDRHNKLVAFDTQAKRLLWTGAVIKVEFPVGHPMVTRQRLLVPASPGDPIAFDAQTGTLLWAAQTGQDAYQTPTVLDDTVYMLGVSSGNIYALSIQDGKELGRLRTGDKVVITNYTYNWRPVAAEGLLIFPVRDKVYAYGD